EGGMNFLRRVTAGAAHHDFAPSLFPFENRARTGASLLRTSAGTEICPWGTRWNALQRLALAIGGI
ncbi:MAG TPA: hypothetical protein VG274_00855, partial [Rhizomicrobium sp.]|nr:hypothetical protein [Rhizomicrobium sp.]